MTFIHEDPDFEHLVRIVADKRKLSLALVEKDYWVTHLQALGVMRQHVLLEVGDARVTPSVARDMSSFVHDEIEVQEKLLGFTENRPKQVQCVHPLVTLLDKLEAIQNRALNLNRAPATFVRHFEDAVRIIRARDRLPPLDGYGNPRALLDDMCAKEDIKIRPTSVHRSLSLEDGERLDAIEKAHAETESLFWGTRITIKDACAEIRKWLAEEIEQRSQ